VKIEGAHNHSPWKRCVQVVPSPEAQALIDSLLQGRTPAQAHMEFLCQRGIGATTLPAFPLAYFQQRKKYLDSHQNSDLSRLQNMRGVFNLQLRHHGNVDPYLILLNRDQIDRILAHGPIRMLFVDGTFGLIGDVTQVMMVVAIDAHGIAVPISVFVQTGKTAPDYKQMLQCLCDAFKIEPETVMFDFEKAEHNAVAQVWPNSRQVIKHLNYTILG
jgi:hypothetical protein